MSNVVPLQQPDVEPAPTFDDFWLLWPAERRLCKKQAREQWMRLDDEQQVAALTALLGWRRVWAKRGEWEFVVHPHRWLRDERYEDALPMLPTMSHASHMPVQSTPLPARGAIPEHVKAALAKLRGKK